MKALKIVFILFFLPLIGFAQNYQEEISKEVINGQEVTVVWTTQKVVKAQPKTQYL